MSEELATESADTKDVPAAPAPLHAVATDVAARAEYLRDIPFGD